MSSDSTVKVGVRVRPLSVNEVEDGCSSCLSYPYESDRIMIGKDKLFSFDFVFDESASQNTVYRKAAFPMVDCVLKGYNATLFAYGQTGSGKTYTMGTCAVEDFSDANTGIVPRIVEDIFARMPMFPYDYTIRVSFLEIYKEDILDLLSDDATVPLPIREDNQVIKIPGLTERLINCANDVLALLQSGSTKRSVGGTAMNSQSSRSHAIFTMHFLLRPKDSEPEGNSLKESEATDELCPGETLTAKLHLVDLAGSERIKRTHAEGDRLKEGININRGLLALGNVISALCEKDAKKRSHIPYRDSRLTRLLQDSLGGNSTTLMLACVSPADCNMEETLNTLRYADRARMIKNKPILNRADPKDAELARLRSLVCQLQARLNKGTGLSLTSPCRPVTATQGSSTFSTNVLSNMVEKTAKLEAEKRKLCDELDRALDDNSELYRKVFDAETLRDAIFTELDKFTTTFNSFKSSISDQLLEKENTSLREFVEKVDQILSAINSLRDSDQSELVRTKLDEAYEQWRAAAESSQVDTSADAPQGMENDTHSPLVKLDGDSEMVETSETMDRRGHELRARRLACKQQIEAIEANLQHKNKLLASLEHAATQGDESYASLLKQYEAQVRELEVRIAELEQERSKLLSENDGTGKASVAIKEQREQRLKAMEQELSRARRELADLSRLKKAKEAREAECMRLRGEIQTLKVSMVRTAKQLKDESAEYRRWRAEKEREVRKLQEHDRRLQSEMSQMASVHERQQAVLKRRIEAAAATERRLKELLMRQRDRRNEREKRQTEIAGTLNKVDFASRVRAWVSADLDIQVGMGEARHHLHELMDSRRSLCDQLRAAEAELAACDVQATAARDRHTAEVQRLTEAIEGQTQQITDLQQKLLDAGERSSSDTGGTASNGQTEQMLSSRLAQLHNIQEARIALRYLFKEAVSAKVKCLVSETQVSELELQLSTQQKESEQLRHKAAEFSMRLAQSEELERQSRDRITLVEKNNSDLQRQVRELQKALVKPKHTVTLKPRKTAYVVNADGEARRLSGTPVVPQRKRVTRQSVQSQVDTKRWHGSPTVLVPDSTRKTGPSLWDAFNEAEDPGDSSLLDPTWRLSYDAAQDDDTLGELPSEVTRNPHPGSNTRCKCRGECLSRCSCRRAGHECLVGHCKCISGKCRNRGTASESSKPDEQSMKPPTVIHFGQKTKRRKTGNPLSQIQVNQSTVPVVSPTISSDAKAILNRTFDLDTDQNRSPKGHHDDLPDASTSLVEISGKFLWPKHRLSYFPSPSLRADR